MSTTQALAQCFAPSRGEHSRPPQFLVGRNRCGRWIVRDARAGREDMFNSRAEALHFAFCQRGQAAGAVVLVPGIIEFFETPANAPETCRKASERVLQEV